MNISILQICLISLFYCFSNISWPFGSMGQWATINRPLVGGLVPHIISIHAPAKGATLYFCICVLLIQISIHAPAKGATAKITKTIPNDFCKINNYNNSFA